jgi:hypothetical protein
VIVHGGVDVRARTRSIRFTSERCAENLSFATAQDAWRTATACLIVARKMDALAEGYAEEEKAGTL